MLKIKIDAKVVLFIKIFLALLQTIIVHFPPTFSRPPVLYEEA
jgi:hypothetical protein